MSGVVAGSLERKEQLLEAIFVEQCRAKQGVAATSGHHHVATSPSHDVGSTMQKSTIHHVATSPRRDVTTSRRHLENLHLII